MGKDMAQLLATVAPARDAGAAKATDGTPSFARDGGRPGAQAGGDSPAARALGHADVLKPLPHGAPAAEQASESGADIAVPEEIDGDGRRRMLFKLGVLAARELALDTGELSAQDLLALGRQTVADHMMAGTADNVLLAMARAEGKVDDTAWKARDSEKIAEQVDAFVRTEFKDEIALHRSLAGLAAEPPLLGRRELADALLREQGIDTEARLGGHDVSAEELAQGELDYEHSSIAGSSAPLIRKWRAGQEYFNRDTLTAGLLRKMRMRGGGPPGEDDIARILRALPASLDGEFTRRFDAHQRRMSGYLSDWIAARLSLHAREHGIDMAGTTVTVSRATLRFLRSMATLGGRYSAQNAIVKPLCGFTIAIQGRDKTSHCFISSRTGAVHAVPPDTSMESWLREHHELAFEDAETRAELDARPGRWVSSIRVEEAVSGPHDTIQERLAGMFHGEIEQGRESARGENLTEGLIDGLLNLIPFRAMVVSLRKGDIPAAIMMGALDVLSLLPLVGAGVRLGGAAAKSAAPWVAMGMRFGGTAGRQGLSSGLRRAAAGIGTASARYDGIRTNLALTAIRGWGRLRPLDLQRIVAALRATSPKLADLLGGIAARARGETIPAGVWRVGGHAATAAEAGHAIGAISPVSARSLGGARLQLLPYGSRAGVYTQIDAVGRRVGALLVSDSGGWLHQALPVDSLERYRVAAPDVLAALTDKRAGPDGTVALGDTRYVRLGDDYVEVIRDVAVSTPGRSIWRAMAPAHMAPDVIAHRLAYDANQGLWHQADVAGLAGGGKGLCSVPACATVNVETASGAGLLPDAAQLARYRATLAAGMRGGTPEQVQAFEALLDRIGSDKRGAAILRAMAVHHELLGQAPDIILRQATDVPRARAQPQGESQPQDQPEPQPQSPLPLRPSLDRPVPGTAWNIDLEALRFGTTDAAVQELAAVYNNMTGLLQNEDPYADMLALGQPALDPGLEQQWADWIAEAPNSIERVSTRNYLARQLREMRCYGGLSRETFKSLLRNQPGTWTVRIKLSFRGLTSIPPLPPDTDTLIVSHNLIEDWRHLPKKLRVLHADHTGMTKLPANLSIDLEELNVSGNFLRDASLALPPKLKRLEIAGNNLKTAPALPNSLEELVIYDNAIQELQRRLPPGLRLLDVSGNALTRVPNEWPSSLRQLYLANNRLTDLPDLSHTGLLELDVSSNNLQTLASLPDTLVELDASGNALTELIIDLPRDLRLMRVDRNRLTRVPNLSRTRLEQVDFSDNSIETLPALPDTLRTLVADGNLLSELSAGLPRGLKVIRVSGNQLRRLPDDLPTGLTILSLERNLLGRLPLNITELESCEIYLHGNPLPMVGIPSVAAQRAGPNFFLTALSFSGGATHAVRPLAQAVRHWWSESIDAQARWKVIEQKVGMQRDAMEFSLFLDRLRRTVGYRDEAFRAQVAEWLVELSRPERKDLLEQSLQTCLGATETCGDRVIATWNDLQTLRRNDDIEHGMYDNREKDVIQVAREMFRLGVLTDIARDKERELTSIGSPGGREPDEVEVYLAYVFGLRESLGLRTIAPYMRFHHLSGVSGQDLATAREAVLAQERVEFDAFLTLDYRPWQTLLRRKNARAYADAEAAALRALEDRFESELQQELDKLGFDANDAPALADARKRLGPDVMRRIRYDAMAPLTRQARAEGDAR